MRGAFAFTDADVAIMRRFSEFLRAAGPPADVGGNPRQRLIDAGRTDLLAWALGETTPVDFAEEAGDQP